jgi:6-pyruvoyltetrahydropterin/6-carboxytetrahydropterin synthase
MLNQYYPQVKHDKLYELNKDFTFAAAHRIPNEKAGACARVHGHNYQVNLTIVGDELDELGFLANFGTLKKVVHGRYDHTYLNDHPEFNSPDESYMFPTTEIVARQIWEIVQDFLNKEQPNRPECLQVIVRETETSYVVFRPKGGK